MSDTESSSSSDWKPLALLGAGVSLSAAGIGYLVWRRFYRKPKGYKPIFDDMTLPGNVPIPELCDLVAGTFKLTYDAPITADEATKLFRAGDYKQGAVLYAQLVKEDFLANPKNINAQLWAEFVLCLTNTSCYIWAASCCKYALNLPTLNELNRQDLVRSYAAACSCLNQFQLSLALSDSIMPLDPEPSVLKCGLTLHKAECYDIYAAQYFYHQEEPIFMELINEALRLCDEASTMVESFGEAYQRNILFCRPESLRISIYMTMGNMGKLEDAYDAYINRIKKHKVSISPMRMARIYEEQAMTCLDSESSAASLAKGEQAYMNALSLYQEIPGVSGLKYEKYLRAEVGSRILQRQKRYEELEELMQSTRAFVEKNQLGAPLMENNEMRVESTRIKYESKLLEFHSSYLLEVRCKRRISTKRSRFPVGAVMKVTICEYDDHSSVLENSSFHIELKDELLNNSVRSHRVAVFNIPNLKLDKKMYLARIRVFHKDVLLSSLDQMLPSYVSSVSSPDLAEAHELESAKLSDDVIKRNF